MEIGSFIELQLPGGKEYYADGKFADMKIARLNSGRAAIYHAFRLTGCAAIWLPYYQCESVRAFLQRKKVPIKYYRISNTFDPIDLEPKDNECILLVNYFGIMSETRMQSLAAQYDHVILDHSQAFFAKPLKKCLNVYSARKFIGVPDGAYVVGEDADRWVSEYAQGHSSDTSLFLLQRIEYGCEGKAYASRSANEARIEAEDILQMSKLTHTILDGTEYEPSAQKRRENYSAASRLFGGINRIDPEKYYDNSCVPMVYPLVVEEDSLLDRLLQAKHFQGRWWQYITEELSQDTFEHYLSRYLIPITIDQRYGAEELTFVCNIIKENL